MPYIRIKVQPYEVIDVDEHNRYLVRFADGTLIKFERPEFFTLVRFTPNWASHFVQDHEMKVIEELVKNGVATTSKEVKPTFTFTIKATKGCNLSCKYCLSGDTRIFMADGSWKPIKEIREGDEVIGWDQKTNRLVKTRVLRTFKRRDTLYLVQTDKVSIKITDNHAILGAGYWYALDPKKASHEVKNARKLRIDTILRFVTFPNEFTETEDYMLGYLSGAFYGDGTYVDQIANGTGRSRYLRLVVRDREFIERIKNYMNRLGIHYTEGVFRATSDKSYKKGEYPRIYVTRKDDIARIQEIHYNNKEWLRGFVASFFDAEGSVSIGKGGPRVESSVGGVRLASTSDELLRIFKLGLEAFGFKYSEFVISRKRGKPQKVIYLFGDGETTVKVRFFTVFRPVILRKVERLLATRYRRTIVTDIKKLDEDWVYNLHTETGTYIAEGLVVHNCYEWAHPEKISMQQRKETVVRTLETFLRFGDIHPIWHGGEPTLLFESLIEPIVEKYGTMGGRIKWSLQSNGVRFANKQFAKKYAKLAKLYGMSTGISIDGFKEDNFMRVFPDGSPAWEYTVKGIQNLVEEGIPPGTIVVVNNRSVQHLPEIVEWLYSMGVRGTRLNPLYPAGHEEVVKIAPNTEDYSEGLVRSAKKVIKINTENGQIEKRITVTNITEALTSMFNTPSSICWRNVCGAGSIFYSIQYDGSVWACDHLSIKLGNINDGWTPLSPPTEDLVRYWEEQALHFQPLFGNPRCAKCPYRTYCNGGGCYAFIKEMYGEDAYKKDPPYCPFRLYQFLEKLIREDRDYEIAALAPDKLHKYWYLRMVES